MPTDYSVSRYDRRISVDTALNPLDDMTAWVRGLRSPGYTERILRDVHSITVDRELFRSTRAVCSYADHAVSFLEQASEGPPSVSFLPTYYALLNLAKIYVVSAGRRTELHKRENRRHGSSYEIKNSHGLLTEAIRLHSSGVLPLFYEAITGETWPIGPKDKARPRRMRMFYPYLVNVSAEYINIYSTSPPLIPCNARYEASRQHGVRIRVTLRELPSGGRRQVRLISGMRQVGDREFVTTYVPLSESNPMETLLNNFPRHLLYGRYAFGDFDYITPIKNQSLHLPQEIPIFLCLFHLSSVVRYNPEFLTKLQTSQAWSLLLSMRLHSVLRFLVLFNSYFRQTQYELDSFRR